ncbi:hypothetical protein I4F81_012511 [Pyropia yezoensis]|uniref:Uncharacterized protein n=1 Tax=Pyropia yezoensis TaxID=2788 RepID=A0ACC3CJN7_PYRYE|nr:hypothetical protein I4F81_012511 [Neopyropia yezoensis]
MGARAVAACSCPSPPPPPVGATTPPPAPAAPPARPPARPPAAAPSATPPPVRVYWTRETAVRVPWPSQATCQAGCQLTQPPPAPCPRKRNSEGAGGGGGRIVSGETQSVGGCHRLPSVGTAATARRAAVGSGAA